jgi:hypothetical protein
VKIAAFNADNANSDDRVDTKDAFISYYTALLSKLSKTEL